MAALNGDVDNHAELQPAEGLRLPAEITTDAKVIPALVSRRLAEGRPSTRPSGAPSRASRARWPSRPSPADEPDRVYLALRGSGQSLYIGLAEDAFVVASEPYGLVEETPTYLRMDGETDPGARSVASAAGTGAGTLEGDATGPATTAAPSRSSEHDVVTAEITTRDIDRGDFPHFLLKEISEAPASFRKTLRGKIATDDDGRLAVRLGEDTMPAGAGARPGCGHDHAGSLVIGQGTAAVAGQAWPRPSPRCLPTRSP